MNTLICSSPSGWGFTPSHQDVRRLLLRCCPATGGLDRASVEHEIESQGV
jgi:hypothetical protein